MILLFDAADAGHLPPETGAFAGYVDGAFRSLVPGRSRFPRATWVSIATSTANEAMVLDVESGDATVDTAAAWLARQHRRGIARPVIYCSLSTVPALEHAAQLLGIDRSAFRLWTAHWTGESHICSKACGVPMIERPGMTQFRNDEARGYDTSVTTPGWLKAVRHDYLSRTPP